MIDYKEFIQKILIPDVLEEFQKNLSMGKYATKEEARFDCYSKIQYSKKMEKYMDLILAIKDFEDGGELGKSPTFKYNADFFNKDLEEVIMDTINKFFRGVN